MSKDTQKIYFVDARADIKTNLLLKIHKLIEAMDLSGKIKKKALVAIKIHFGERGNTAHLRPTYVRPFVDTIKGAGGIPFVTDCNTLYVGGRGESASHLMTAYDNGFTPGVLGAPVIIADGLRGDNVIGVPIAGEIFKEAFIGSDIVKSDFLVCLTHFKGHELSGFGGSIKNLGMGCAGREGKLAQHSSVSPAVKAKTCTACGDCTLTCPADAITVNDVAEINPEVCIGCGQCILTCPTGSIRIVWNEPAENFQKKMTEYTLGVLAGKEEKTVFFNFIMNVTPQCDCYPFSDAPIVGDIGILAGTDPVAIDQASVDLVNQAPGISHTALSDSVKAGDDKFRAVAPHADWSVQLSHGETVGLGTRKYELIKV
jgi:uncharacterized Fe-S center protein